MPEDTTRNTSNNKFTIDYLIANAHRCDQLIQTEEDLDAALAFIQPLIDPANDAYDTFSSREFVAFGLLGSALYSFNRAHPRMVKEHPELELVAMGILTLVKLARNRVNQDNQDN